MTTNVDVLHIRRTLGRDLWGAPKPFGPDGWTLTRAGRSGSVIVTCAPDLAGVDWLHASIAYPDHVPSYRDLTQLHYAVWRGQGWAYQVFAPIVAHVNIHENALHLWGRHDGKAAMRNPGEHGSI